MVSPIKQVVAKAKETVKQEKKKDTSKLNLLATKLDMRVVLLESALADHNLKRAEEIVRKIAALEVQVKEELQTITGTPG